MSHFENTRIDGTAAVAAWKAGALLVDVRSPAGRAKNGELAGTVVVAKTDVVDFVTRTLKHRQSPVVLFCGSVAGTEKLVTALVAQGVSDVAEVDGGFDALLATGALERASQPAG